MNLRLIRSFVSACGVVSTLLVAAAPSLAQEPAYDVIELGADQGSGVSTSVYKVSADRVVLGDVVLPTSRLPVVFSPDGTTTQIAPADAVAQRMNAKGVVAIEYLRETWLWRDRVLTKVPRLPSGKRLEGVLITDDGSLYGTERTYSFVPMPPYYTVTTRPYRYAGGQYAELTAWGPTSAQLRAANARGSVAGYQFDFFAGILGTVRLDADGTITDLAALFVDATSSIDLAAMSVQGDVVGTVFYNGRSNGAAFVTRGNATRVFGLPGQRGSDAYGINRAGVVVGRSYPPEYEEPPGRALVWRNGTTTDISQLPEAIAAGWSRLVRAVDINDDGVIVGVGVRQSGETRGFMLVPRN